MKSKYLLLLWLVVPIVRESIWYSGFSIGLRQIMEVIPALAVLSGVGANYLLGKIKSKSISFAIIPITLAVLLVPIIHLHPNENVYFNNLAGGIKGARQKQLVHWSITYGNIYKQGVAWLNAHAEKNARLAHLDGSMYAISPLWLRNDISISPYHFSGLGQKGEYIITIIHPLDPPYLAYGSLSKFLTPIHTIAVDGQPLLEIYKNDRAFLKGKIGKIQELAPVLAKPVQTKEADYFEIDLGKTYFVTGISIKQLPPTCAGQESDFFGFVPDIPIGKKENLEANIFIPDKKMVAEEKISFSFPALSARYIDIYPRSEESCFIKGRITSVTAIPQ